MSPCRLIASTLCGNKAVRNWSRFGGVRQHATCFARPGDDIRDDQHIMHRGEQSVSYKRDGDVHIRPTRRSSMNMHARIVRPFPAHAHPFERFRQCIPRGLRPLSTSSGGDAQSSQHDHDNAKHALTRLTSFLSPTNLSSPTPSLLTANAIKSLYRSVTHRKQVRELGSEGLSTLIALFGRLSSLSKDDGARGNLGTVKEEEGEVIAFDDDVRAIVGSMGESAKQRAHWGFVLMVAEDKKFVGFEYSEGDHYWLLKAALADVEKLAKEDASAGQARNIKSCLHRARQHYMSLARVSASSPPSPSQINLQTHYHTLYLSTLSSLSPNRPQHLSEIVSHLAYILRRNGWLHPRFVQMLWRIMALERPGEVEIDKKAVGLFVEAVGRKVGLATRRSYDETTSVQVQISKQSVVRQTYQQVFTASSLRAVLLETLFSRRVGLQPTARDFLDSLASSRSADSMTEWVCWQACAALDAFSISAGAGADFKDKRDVASLDEERYRRVWRNLKLLALSFQSSNAGASMRSTTPPEPSINARPNKHSTIDFKSNPSPSFNASSPSAARSSPSTAIGWTLISSLSALSSLPSLPVSPTSTANVNTSTSPTTALSRPLLSLFTSLLSSPHPTSPPVPLAVTLSFLNTFTQLAARERDAWLCEKIGRVLERVVDDLMCGGGDERGVQAWRDEVGHGGWAEVAVAWSVMRVLCQIGGWDVSGRNAHAYENGEGFQALISATSYRNAQNIVWENVWADLHGSGLAKVLSSFARLLMHTRASEDTGADAWKGDFVNAFVVRLARYDALAAFLFLRSATPSRTSSPASTSPQAQTLSPTHTNVLSYTYLTVSRALAHAKRWDEALVCLEHALLTLSSDSDPDSDSDLEDVQTLMKMEWEVASRLVRHVASLRRETGTRMDRVGRMYVRRVAAAFAEVVRRGSVGLGKRSSGIGIGSGKRGGGGGLGKTESRVETAMWEKLLLMAFEVGKAKEAVRALCRLMAAETAVGTTRSASSFDRSRSHVTFSPSSQFIRVFVAKLVAGRCYGHLRTLATAVARHSCADQPTASPKSLADLLNEHPVVSYLAMLVSRRAQRATFKPPSDPRVLPLPAISFAIHDWPHLRRVLRLSDRVWQLDERVLSVKISHALNRARRDDAQVAPMDPKTAERLVYVLAKAGRARTALRLVKEGKLGVEGQLTTKMGNILLSSHLRFLNRALTPQRHAPKHDARSRISLRRVLKVKRRSRRLRPRSTQAASQYLQSLVREYAFVPDRITLNILMRAFLERDGIRAKAAQNSRRRRTTNTSSEEISLRAVFDRLIANGFPSGSRGVNTVFNTLPASNRSTGFVSLASASAPSQQLGNSKLTSPLSFQKHVRPLYHMFVRAFRRRGDHAAAERVKEVLKMLQRRGSGPGGSA